MHTTPYGFSGLRCGTVKQGDKHFLSLEDFPEDAMGFEVITSHEDWRCILVEPAKADDGLIRLRVHHETGQALLKYSALRGFPRMTVFWLKKLRKLLGVPGAQPSNEVGWVRALARHILEGQASEENLAAAVKSRSSCEDDVQVEQLMQLEELLEEEAGDGDDFQDAELQAELDECKRKRVAKMAREARAAADNAKAAQAQEAAANNPRNPRDQNANRDLHDFSISCHGVEAFRPSCEMYFITGASIIPS